MDLQTFKVKKCDMQHPMSLSPLQLDCPFFHSRQDKRRSPFANSQSAITYSHIYIQDFYSTQMASNMIQHLFHPDIYKTIPCQNRFSTNYSKNTNGCQECKVKWCPYLHQGENTSALTALRGLPMLVPIEQKYIQKIEGVQDVKMLIKGEKNQIKFNFTAQVQKCKQRLKEAAKKQQIRQGEGTKKLIPALPAKLQLQKAENNTSQQSWYKEYQYFYFGQKLPIIEDRHHQFKNYKDIVNKDIAPIVMKYICAFLNTDGGVLYVGVDDNSVACGFKLKQHQFDRFLVNLDGQSKNNMIPPLMPYKFAVRRIPVTNHPKGKQLWIVQIKVKPSQKQKKSKNLTLYNKEAYIRMNASTHRLDAISLIQYMRHNQQKRLEEQSGSQLVEEVMKQLEEKGKSMTLNDWLLTKQKMVKLNQKIEEQISLLRKRQAQKSLRP